MSTVSTLLQRCKVCYHTYFIIELRFYIIALYATPVKKRKYPEIVQIMPIFEPEMCNIYVLKKSQIKMC